MPETFPTRLVGTCTDCGTTTTCDHASGLGGEGLGWPCPVCVNPTRMDGSNYIETERSAR